MNPAHRPFQRGDRRLFETLRNSQDRKVRGFTFRNLIPVKRRGNARVWQRSHGIRGTCGPILCILVVVEKDAMPLFLPPFRARKRRQPTFDRTRQSQRSPSNFREGPPLMNPDIDVHSA